MNQVGIVGVYPRVFIFLVFSAVAFVIFVKDVMIVDQCIGRSRKKLQQQFLHFRIKHTLHFSCVIKVFTFRFAVGK